MVVIDKSAYHGGLLLLYDAPPPLLYGLLAVSRNMVLVLMYIRVRACVRVCLQVRVFV